MMKFKVSPFLLVVNFLVFLFFFAGVSAEPRKKLSINDCRIIEDKPVESDAVVSFSDALLWKVSKPGVQSSYLFGTIHVSDPKITNLPKAVETALHGADIFVMEALPEPEEAMKLSQMMFSADGSMLNDHIDDDVFKQTSDILLKYQLPIEVIQIMKPWAAFLMMSYPVDNTLPLDLKLYQIASSRGAKVSGLETLTEQGAVFSVMPLQDQLKLLMDTVCNYDQVSKGIDELKELYLNKDLTGMVMAGKKHPFAEEKIYKDLNERLLTERNQRMVERMQTSLNEGNAFIAVGALHLPGDEGVLAGLSQQGYKIEAVY